MNNIRNVAHEGAMFAALAGMMAASLLVAREAAEIVVKLGYMMM